MAALFRQGARRIGGSVLQRTQAAVAEERRRLVQRRFSTDAEAKAREEVQQQMEKLYVSLSKVQNWRDTLLLQDLAAQVKPRAQDSQWRRLRASRWFTNVVRGAGNVSFAFMLVVGGQWYFEDEDKKKIALALNKQLEKEVQEQEQEQ